MSGSFNDLDVPPTLTSFAVAPVKADKVISQEIKKAGSKLVMFTVKRDENDLPKFDELKKMYDTVHQLILDGKVLSASVVKGFGLVETVSKMSFGNMIGVEFDKNLTNDMLFYAPLGSIVLEVEEEIDGAVTVGTTGSDSFTVGGVNIPLSEAAEVWKKPLEKVFPTKAGHFTSEPETFSYDKRNITVATEKFAKPRVFIPVFPGTNCEYDTARAFENAGAVADVFVVRNLTGDDVVYSMKEMQKRINNSQIVMIPGGFSGGDEPEGSGKFIATAFRNPLVKDAVMNMLKNRDGLMLGICNGFQALIKLGLVPYGEICGQKADSPTLTFNTIGRHISKMVYTKVVSNKSPWLQKAQLGGVYCNPASHGEGRFVANEEWLQKLFANGQVATQYVTPDGQLSVDEEWNVNGSYMNIEGITSPDGRILGKMAHSERRGDGVAINIYGQQDIKIFESGVEYFK
mgnify:CR=1 FL=1